MFENIKSVRSGQKKAIRDYRKILAHLKEHEQRHNTIPGYECGKWDKAFWDSVEYPVDIDEQVNPIEAAVYGQAVKDIQTKAAKGAPEFESSQLTVEVRGDESPEQVIEKITQAVKTKIAFDEIVDTEQVSETKKRGGK